MSNISSLQQFREWYEGRHQYAKTWKEKTGEKVLGYFCTYVPEEILYAAGVLPVRIYGSHEPQDVTEPHIFSMYCPFTRDCLAQGLKGKYNYLNGLMIAQSCLHIRQAFTSWRQHKPLEYSYYLPMPSKLQSPRSHKYLHGEYQTFKKSVEEWTGKTIHDEDLNRGIDILNKNRRLIKKIYELRRSDKPPITGLEAMEIVVSSQLVDKREHTELLSETLKELEEYTPDKEPGVRLMKIGSEDDDRDFLKMVESLGATFVTDDHCTGSRYFWNETKNGDDQLAAIATRYIERPACPSKDWPERTRIPHILDLAKQYNVQGVILAQQKFCDPHELDFPSIAKSLKEQDISSMQLEFDVTVPAGQFQTRVEAFLEMIREEELF